MYANDQILKPSFLHWTRQNKWVLIVTMLIILLQFYIFKLFYPYPNFFPDSYSYVEAAINRQPINIWPIGYSKFLWMFSFITRSPIGLTWFQYLIFQGALIYLLFSVTSFFAPGKTVFGILLYASVCNPLVVQVSNLISSDALFATLSLIWFTQLIWILFNPSLSLLLSHALILFLVFTTRYNAMYFPIISIALIISVKTKPSNKLIAVSSIIFMIGAFIGYTQYHYKTKTGEVQFSPFGGWQIASNALYAYAHIPKTERKIPPLEYKQLQILVDRSADSLKQIMNRPDAALGAYYLWNEWSPLKQRMNQVWKNDTSRYFTHWSLMANIYKRYGSWLIKNYPDYYLKYYIYPNFENYCLPPIEFLGDYNMGKGHVEPLAVSWFRLTGNKVIRPTRSDLLAINKYIVVLVGLFNFLFLTSMIGCLVLKCFKGKNKFIKRIIIWFTIYWCCNLSFSVLSSPIVLRYQTFPMLLTVVFTIWLLSQIIQASQIAQHHNALELNNQKLQMN